MPISRASREAVRLAVIKAGQLALDIQQQGEFRGTLKTDSSPVTRADLDANECLLRAISGIDERYPVISEESSLPLMADGPFWVVDPLDGTKEFMKGLPDFTVNVALVLDGSPVIGFVGAPAHRFLMWTDGQELRFEGELKLSFDRKVGQGSESPVKVAVSASHVDAHTSRFVSQLGAVETISAGSSIKIAALAQGVAHIYPRFGPTMLWDTAAADACLRASGGALYGPDGIPLRYEFESLRNPPFLGIAPEIRQKEKYLSLMKEVLQKDLSE